METSQNSLGFISRPLKSARCMATPTGPKTEILYFVTTREIKLRARPATENITVELLLHHAASRCQASTVVRDSTSISRNSHKMPRTIEMSIPAAR